MVSGGKIPGALSGHSTNRIIAKEAIFHTGLYGFGLILQAVRSI
jgi:hypothetical protein